MHATPGPRRITLTAGYGPGRDLVCVRVADNGPGVPFEIQSRIFEPFFTTKPLGIGTGIGLALCQRIVDAHRGTIRLDSEPGQGATFILEFPIEKPPVGAADVAGGDSVPRSRQVLVVDDEPDTAETLADLLREDDHHVEIATNGVAAIRKILGHEYDLIFSDLRMPVLDGPGLYRELRRERPHLLKRVIFVTGDTLSPQALELLHERRPVQITKPFVLEEIRAAIAHVLRPSE